MVVMLYKPSRCVRFLRRKAYPWTALAVAPGKVLWLWGTERDREKACLMMALAKIDFVGAYAFLNDLLW